MFDAHRHGPCSDAHGLPPRWGALVASSGPRQWAQMVDSPPPPNVRYCFGLLPQEIQAFSDTGVDIEHVLENLEKLIATQRDSAVGEIGIDDRFNQSVPMRSQLLLVERMIGLAQSLDRPAILHVVRADGLMLNLLRRMKPRIPLLWHGFLGSLETARELASLGCVVSIAPSVWRTGTKLQDRLNAIQTPVLLETDYPYHYRSPGEAPNSYKEILEHHYRRFAQATGISVEALERRCDGYAQVFTNQ